MNRHAKRESSKSKRPKTKLGLPDVDHSKSAVLDSLRSPESKRGYRHAIEILLSGCGRDYFVPRSMSRMSEFSRNRSNMIRRPSGVRSKVRITAGLLSRVKRRERIVRRSSTQKSCPAKVLPSMEKL